VRVNRGGDFARREFPPERKRIDIGDFVTDDRRFRGLTGWAPRIGIEEGLRRSLDYYRRHFPLYL
jgi:UDP-glucose 4-epimerase